MILFEIIRDDNVSTFKLSESVDEFEKNYLLMLRIENKKNSFNVYELDEDLNRIGKEKTYIPYAEDRNAQEEMEKIKNKTLEKLFLGDGINLGISPMEIKSFFENEKGEE